MASGGKNKANSEKRGQGAGLVTLTLLIITIGLALLLIRGFGISILSREIVITAFSVFASATVTGALFNFGTVLRRLTRDFEEIVRTADQMNEEAIFHWTLSDCDEEYLKFQFEYTMLVENRTKSPSFEYIRQSFAFPIVVATAARLKRAPEGGDLQVSVFRGRTQNSLDSSRAEVTKRMFEWTNKELGIFKLKFFDHPQHRKIWYRVVLRGYAPKRNLDTLYTLRPHNRVEVRVTLNSDHIYLVSRTNQRINRNFDEAGDRPKAIRITESFDSSDTDGGRARIYAQVFWSDVVFPETFVQGVRQASAEADDLNFFE